MVASKKNTPENNKFRKYYVANKINLLKVELGDIQRIIAIIKKELKNEFFVNLATRHIIVREARLKRKLEQYSKEYQQCLKSWHDDE